MSAQLPSRQIGRAGDLSLTQKQLHQMKKALDLQKFEVLQLHRKTISHFFTSTTTVFMGNNEVEVTRKGLILKQYWIVMNIGLYHSGGYRCTPFNTAAVATPHFF